MPKPEKLKVPFDLRLVSDVRAALGWFAAHERGAEKSHLFRLSETLRVVREHVDASAQMHVVQLRLTERQGQRLEIALQRVVFLLNSLPRDYEDSDFGSAGAKVDIAEAMWHELRSGLNELAGWTD